MSNSSPSVAAAAAVGVQYVYATIVTSEAVAANNRGRNNGNITTLQKCIFRGNEHTTVSAEAMRFAVRYWMQLNGVPVNRAFDRDTNKFVYQDEKYGYWPEVVTGKRRAFADDDVLGFMNAQAPKEADADNALDAAEAGVPEGEVEEPEEAPEPTEEDAKGKGKKKRAPKAKGTAMKRTSPLSVSRAISLKPWVGENSFNCVGGVKEQGKLSLYGAEVHTTPYQFTVALDTKSIVDKVNIGRLIDALTDPCPVAGNHARFYYEFAPESVVYRVSNHHSSRIQNVFEYDDDSHRPVLPRLIEQVECGDCPASEVIVGGEVARTDEGQKLTRLGCKVFLSVFAAAREVKRRVAANGGDYVVVGEGVTEQDKAIEVAAQSDPDSGGTVAGDTIPVLVANPT